jgi:hypothetical protein
MDNPGFLPSFVNNDYAFIILIMNPKTFVLQKAPDRIAWQELRRPCNAIEDQAESPPYKGSSPVSMFRSIKEISTVAGVQGKGGPLPLLDT